MGIFGGSAQDEVDLGAINDRLARLESAVASLQGQVATLTTGAGPYAATSGDTAAGAPPPQAEWLAEVRALKEGGHLIEAIKAYRLHTDVGLKEAKDAVEGMI